MATAEIERAATAPAPSRPWLQRRIEASPHGAARAGILGGPRTILLAQLSGSTDHQVVSSSDPASRYAVHTPNGDSLAKGTRFHVSISPALVTRVGVEAGTVAVMNANVTV